jgi:hypothetical protein
VTPVEQPSQERASRGVPVELPLEVVATRRDLLGAVNLCIDVSGLDAKEIYIDLGIDAGHFSHMRRGEAHFPLNKLPDLMRLCGNEIPLVWLAHNFGKGLVHLESETQRQLREERERNADLIAEITALRNLVKGSEE